MAELPPDDVQRLLVERQDARRRRDFAAADALRDQIHALGWEVQDGPTGSTARPALPVAPSPTGHLSPASLESVLDQAATVPASLQVVVEDDVEDFERFVRALARHPQSVAWELVVVANAPDADPEPLLERGLAGPVSVLPTQARLGWADAHNLALRRSRGAVTVMIDTSLEPTGDFLGPLLAAFEDPEVGLAGGWGVVSGDGRHFVEAPPGPVDAVEAYCLAVRREALRTVAFDSHFRFYRNADLDFSFAVRAAGWQAVRTPPLPFRQHQHRGWGSQPEAERDRLSRRNFYRFLKHWGDRRDLLLHPDPPRIPQEV